MAVMTENRVIPKKRFSSFDSNWITKLYGDIYSFYSTNSLSRDKLNYLSGKVFNIHYGDIHTKFATMFDLKKESTPLINLEVDLSKYSEEKYCKDGDLVIADASEDYADIGKTIELINLNNERVLAGLHTFLARPNKYEMALGFAGYLMQSWSVRKQVMVIAQGSKVLGLATGRLAKIKLFIPEYQEQQKIASFLSSVDEKLQQLTKKKELLSAYKKGVMQKTFSQELRFKDEFGNNYPDWEEKKLGEVGETFNGLTGKTKVDFGIGKPFIQYMQIFNSAKIDTSKFGYVDISEGEKQKTAKYGDVFFTTSSETPLEIGYASVLTEEIEEVYLNSFCFGYRPNSLTELYPDFSSYLFRSEFLRKQIVKLAQGSTRYNMSKVQLMKVLIQLPSFDEQQKIANFLSLIDKKIELISSQIENTKAFKKGLLQQMFV